MLNLEKVKIETDGSVVVITLNDPQTLNALDAQMANELRTAIRYVDEHDHGFRCLVLTGAGRGFCSGGNVVMMDKNRQARDAGEPEIRDLTLGTHHHYILKKIRALPFPVITAVNGPAAGLGFSYAISGDMIAATKSAFFLAAFRRIGRSPDGGLTWMLPRMIGWARAKELIMMGKRLPAEQALEWGLINRVYDDDGFMDEVLQLAHELANGPTVALGISRGLAWDSWDHSYEQQLDLEERLQRISSATEDATEGGRAMLEKRDANFKGK